MAEALKGPRILGSQAGPEKVILALEYFSFSPVFAD